MLISFPRSLSLSRLVRFCCGASSGTVSPGGGQSDSMLSESTSSKSGSTADGVDVVEGKEDAVDGEADAAKGAAGAVDEEVAVVEG